jgi:hypothetical protein
MRKILMNPQQYNYAILKKRMTETINKAKGIVDDKYITPVERGLKTLDEIITMMSTQLMEGKIAALFANSTPLQQAMFPLISAWLHLWSMTITIPQMKALVGDLKGADRKKLLADNAEAAYYSGLVLSSQFYIASEFPKFFGKVECIMNNDISAIVASADVFTGALKE